MDPGVLAGTVSDGTIKSERDAHDVVGQRLQGVDRGGGLVGQRHLVRVEARDLQGELSLGDRLAGQDVALLDVLSGQDVGGIGHGFDLTLKQLALAACAPAHTAVVRERHALGERGLEDRLASGHLQRATLWGVLCHEVDLVGVLPAKEPLDDLGQAARGQHGRAGRRLLVAQRPRG